MDKSSEFLTYSMILLILMLWSSEINSQQLITSWTQSMSNGNISLNLAMGEVYSSTLRSEGSIVSIGFYHGTPDSISFTNDRGDFGYFILYPNPAREFITVKSDRKIKMVELRGSDGKIHPVFFEQNQVFEAELQLPAQSGNYILHLYSSGMSRPVIKQVVKI